MLNWTLFVLLPAMKLAVHLDSGGKTFEDNAIKSKSARGNKCGGVLTAINKWQTLEMLGDNLGLRKNSIECEWRIKTKLDNMRVKFHVKTKFKMAFKSNDRQNSGCEKNFVEIRYVNDLNKIGARYCSGFDDTYLISWSHWMIVRYNLEKQFKAESSTLQFTAKYKQVSACKSEPCQNGGECRWNSRQPGYRCKCNAQFDGAHCEIQIGQLTRKPLAPGENSIIPWSRKPASQTKSQEKPGENQKRKITKKADEIGVGDETTESYDSDTPGISGGVIAVIAIGLVVVVLLAALIIAAVNRKQKNANERREALIGEFVNLPTSSQNKSNFSKEQSHNSVQEGKPTLTSKTITMFSKVLPSGRKTAKSEQEINGKESGGQPSGGQKQNRRDFYKSTEKVTQLTSNKLPYSMTGKLMTSRSKPTTSGIKRLPLTPGGGQNGSTRLFKPSMKQHSRH